MKNAENQCNFHYKRTVIVLLLIVRAKHLLEPGFTTPPMILGIFGTNWSMYMEFRGANYKS